jgi:hypothetical protein
LVSVDIQSSAAWLRLRYTFIRVSEYILAFEKPRCKLDYLHPQAAASVSNAKWHVLFEQIPTALIDPV